MYSKGVHPVFKNIALYQLEKECRAAVESYSFVKEIDFHYMFEDAIIRGDLGLLSLALQNLVFNAIDAIEENEEERGSIYIRSESDGKNIHFIIEDSGIPLENPEKLFEAFHTTKTKGHGLGLVLSKQIVEAHHGSIHIEIDPKRFIITLPKSENSF